MDMGAFSLLLERIERAIDAHPVLCRRRAVRRLTVSEHAEIVVSHDGFTARIGVRVGRQRNMTPATATDDTAEGAVDKLIASLDIIAESFR